MIVMKILSSPTLRRTAPAAVAAAVLLAGCGGPLDGDSADGPRVVTSFYPLEYVAQRVAGDHAEVVNLTSPGQEPHDLEMSLRQTAEISEADLLIYEKGLQPAVDEAVAEHGPERTVEATEVVDLAPLDEAAHEGESAEDHEAHADAEGDLHFWLDPLRMIEVATAVQQQMAEVDPDNAGDYEANLQALREDLETLDADYEAGLSECSLDTVVVSHDAFGYLERYGLHFEPIAGLSPDAEPSPAHLGELAELIDKEGITTVFSESLASPAMAETLARELDVETAVLDPLEGLSDDTADEDYLSLMRANLDALQDANGCR